MKREEALADIRQQGGQICGRFRADQLSPPWRIVPLRKNLRRKTWRWMAATLAICGWTTPHALVAQIMPDVNQVVIQPAQQPGLLQGTVRGHHAQEPLAGATLALMHGDDLLAGGHTDSLGHFSLPIPTGWPSDQPLTIKLRYLQTVFIAEGLPPEGATLVVELNEVIWLEEVVVTAYHSPHKQVVVSMGLVSIREEGTRDRKLPLAPRLAPHDLRGYRTFEDWIFMNHSEVSKPRF
jgi:hypothetical protein